MAVERTLSIIKPDAVGANHIGEIYSRFEKAGLKIIAAKTPNAINENILRFQVLKEIQPRFIRNQPA